MPDIVVMFFLLGLVAGLVRSDLTIPKAAYDTLSLLLMLTIGLKGGMSLYGNLRWQLIPELIAVMALGAIIPLVLFPLLRKLVRLSLEDAASIAAHYGSVSAGTFAVALAYAEANDLAISPEVTLYLVAMELPAIIVGLLLYRRYNKSDGPAQPSLAKLWHEAFTNRGVILLLGGVIIGFMYGPVQGASVTDLYTGAFKAVLALFLLEMGLVAAETLRPFPWQHWRLLTFALLAPSVLSLVGIATGKMLGLAIGGQVILASLTASASYIAAPVAIKGAIPKADIGLAMLSSLGLTFPFNVIVGIGFYHWIILSV
ncbi:sodium-dependent bicarbonate transport family permease [Simiduia agarivorans]|uniref:Permease n=1 Tax=Simiduia agarivorans (strain DSM 21679 / JCM 13881 / BCRC 17597 / SA1) TaxID=1117647 RepID=K4L3J7_SIMAS|nr:sodium-dependent bicarbonate transport family permease [Simiduia agarivorans]AFV00763.1 permease [Simiduia agarivorans SA1 = DSM 21679]